MVPAMLAASQDGFIADASSFWNFDPEDPDDHRFEAFLAFSDTISNKERWLDTADTNFPPPPSPAWLRIKLPTAKIARAYRHRTSDFTRDNLPHNFKFQGSQNGVGWVTLDTQVAASPYENTGPGLRGEFNASFANETAYLYYRLFITAVDDPEFEFTNTVIELDIFESKLVLVSSSPCPARFVPTQAQIFMLEEDEPDEESSTVGSDIKAFVSRDDGTTFTEVTLAEQIPSVFPLASGTTRQIGGVVDLTSQPEGATMRWKIEGLKPQRYHAVDLFWTR